MGLFGKIAGSFLKERVSNTKTALQLIIEDFKKILLVLKWIFVAFSATTLIYGIVTNTGTRIINILLLGLLLVYSLLDTILRLKEKPEPTRKLRIIYVWMKIFLNAVALVSSIYSLYSATASEIKPISILLVTLSLIMFILKVLVEITYEILQSKWSLFKNALIMDAKEHPLTSGKLFSPLIGDIEEVEVKESVAKRIKDRQNKE